ncbi:uncharacterized protein LOC8271784 [Ricinus communis]|uniref:DUF7950 domain-containing protein n=1 Tax=Ricinus communis TaxID=3988 RepID=B9RBM9_RICCO|nr:uncharacterized protein LOC8271784 [Ricinus communis]XP_048230552.1 uncharacterized protein LOC8271784 [Ricinus communis]EEF50950.1 conserved hypothetical protein [Ricinus communis]|eukprot:XP_002509563.1 uncharacterized protein LOC8271784 [Ricinus communis]
MDCGDQLQMISCGGGARDKTTINQIMLRFRPIAPKPANVTGGQDCSLMRDKSILVSKKRKKRKYVRVTKNSNRLKRNQRKIRQISSSDREKEKENGRENDGDGFNKIVTLQLLPERSDALKELGESGRLWRNREENNNNDNSGNNNDDKTMRGLKLKQPETDIADQSMVPKKKVILESWVTVECVTDSCMDERGGLGCTDVERVKNLEENTRPGFITDGSDTVRWVNGAYKRRMMKEENNQEMEIMVWLVTKGKLMPYAYCSAFTCWVRLQYYMTLEKDNYYCCSQIVPCDVWRMDCGGFAWRLDVEAALSLGR